MKFLILGLLMLAHTAMASQVCVKTGTTCVDGPSTKNISGQQVFEQCWQYQDTYSCEDSSLTQYSGGTSCATLRNQGCGVESQTCVATDPSSGACLAYSATYSCQVTAGSTSTQTSCNQSSFCVGGNPDDPKAVAACFNASQVSDPDFGTAVAALETARQAGAYLDPAKMKVFNGQSAQCRIFAASNINCCNDAQAGQKFMSNAEMIYSLYSNVSGGGSSSSNGGVDPTVPPGDSGGGYQVDSGQVPNYGNTNPNVTSNTTSGSQYTYDTSMGGGNDYSSTLSDELQGQANSYVENPGFWVAMGEWVAGDISTTTMLSECAPGPWSVIILAIEMFGVLDCTPDEQMLIMKQSTHLCHFVADYNNTDSKLLNDLGNEHVHTYCCFNSVLARIVNEQGRVQLNRGWGTFDHPDCDGFAVNTPQPVSELAQLDFSKMDFSEFIADITPHNDLNQTNVNTQLQQEINTYYSNGGTGSTGTGSTTTGGSNGP